MKHTDGEEALDLVLVLEVRERRVVEMFRLNMMREGFDEALVRRRD